MLGAGLAGEVVDMLGALFDLGALGERKK